MTINKNKKKMKFMDAIEAIIYRKEVKEVESIARTKDNENEDDIVVLNDDKTSNVEQKQRATEATEYNDNSVIKNNSKNENKSITEAMAVAPS